MTFDEKMDAYAERFNDQFPRMAFMGWKESELEEMLDKALRDGIPVDPYKDAEPCIKY